MTDSRRRYWTINLRYVAILLAIWFAVSYGAGILFVQPLNRVRVGGFHMGFWFAQQGSHLRRRLDERRVVQFDGRTHCFLGRDGSVYLMGSTGGSVLLALLLAPYLRRFGKYTVPDFVGDRY